MIQRLSLAALLLLPFGAASCGSDSNQGGPADLAAEDGGDVADGSSELDTRSPDGKDLSVPDESIDTTEACLSGDLRCGDEMTVLSCQEGVWITSQICSAGQLCLGGQCGLKEACSAGTVKGCYSVTAISVCDPTGQGFIPVACDTGEQCSDGQCKQLTCYPGQKQCAGSAAYTMCLTDGSGWGDPIDCLATESCVGGQCLDSCATDPKFNQSNVGCEFWSLDLGQWEVKEGEMNLDPSACTIPHAVVVGNPNDLPVYVTFETGEGQAIGVPDPTIGPGETKAFEMPVLSLQESGVFNKAIRLRTNRPVTAAQFNPPSNEDFVHTSDASLLFPPSILGKEYYAVSMPSWIGLDMPMVGKSPSVWGYFAVAAVEPGTTSVTVTLPCDTEPGPDFPGYAKGDTITVELQQFQVLNVNSLALGMMATQGNDLTGAHIVGSQKLAAFSGHQCTTLGESNCDHLETSLLPVDAWGQDYVAARMNIVAPNMYRVLAGADNVQLTTDPIVPELDGKTLNKGQWLEVSTVESFTVHATGPIQVVQFMEGNAGQNGSTPIDPSMTILVPNYQFRDDYPILVPAAYDADFVVLVKMPDTDIEMDGSPLGSVSFSSVGVSDWEVANVPVEAGLHRFVGDGPFGLISYGYASKVSYAYPAGLNGKIVTE